jgi:hypothetical protein
VAEFTEQVTREALQIRRQLAMRAMPMKNLTAISALPWWHMAAPASSNL